MCPDVRLGIQRAREADVPALFELRRRAADALTRRHGRGPWSSIGTERGVLRGVLSTHVLVGSLNDRIVGALGLQSRKPWAIDPAYFTATTQALYLVDMRVDPACQGQGLGRQLVEAAFDVGTQLGALMIRLDAFDAAAGAGPFYLKCGFTEVGRKTYRGVPLIYFERAVPSPRSPLGT